MNKCPHCGAILKTLTRVCEACGSEIKPEASVSSESSNPKSPVLSAAELSNQINESLSALKSQPPVSNFKSFVIGLFLLPTLGLSYLVVKALSVFGRIGRSPERVKLALDQSLRTAETSFKSDPDMKKLMEGGHAGLNTYARLQQASRKAMIFGLLVAIILCVAVPLIIQHQAKVKIHRAALVEQQATLTQIERLADEVKAGKARAIKEYADLLKNSLTAQPSVKSDGITRLAVLVADGKQSDPAMTQSLVNLLQDSKHQVTGGLFTESFVSSGLFDKVFNSDLSVIKDLNLASVADEVLLVKKNVIFTVRPEFSMTDATMTLSLKFIRAASGAVLDSYTFNGDGEDFNQAKAEAEAAKRIIGQFSEIKTTR